MFGRRMPKAMEISVKTAQPNKMSPVFVIGTLAGHCVSASLGMSDYSGVAMGAKIAFFDAGGSTGRLSIPSNLSLRMFPPGRDDGVMMLGTKVVVGSIPRVMKPG